MASGMGSKSAVVYLFLKFAKQHRPALVAYSEAAILNPSKFYLLLGDYIYDKLKLHSPKHGHHPLILESHDQLRWQLHHSKHNDCYPVQKLPDEIVALRDDMESSQTYLI
jgi:hypothetical protein